MLFLAALYESFLDAFLILPSALSGVLGGLIGMYMINASLNNLTFAALISLLALIGKYGIFIISFSNDALAKENTTIQQAALQGSLNRLRPIVITTLAMILGFVCVLFNGGEDALARYQFGVTMISGFILGTLITLFITPIFYISFKR